MERPVRKSPRLKNYDYSQNGAYFLTVCSINRECIFSRIVADRVVGIVDRYIRKIPEVYGGITVDNYVIMPNHVHILLAVGGVPGSARPTVSRVVSALKRFSNRDAGEAMWQASFYDHVVRGVGDYLTRWNYIDENPARWYYGKGL